MGYLEWGKGKKAFLFQAELELFSKMPHEPLSVLHPFTVLPVLGQVLLLFSLFQKQPGKIVTYAGIGCISLLLLLIFAVGCMSLNLKIMASVIPFLTISYITIKYHWRKKQDPSAVQ
ncbi:MAG: hypothetical protein MUE71_08140 [Chitinophagaceae bacterium]|nr:hypothetical protein [Chitinophagaceae bacterium]